MGCDIHLYKEKKINGQWVSADEGWNDEYNDGYEDVPYDNRFTDRDYDLFGFLCKGVRREFDYSLIEKGMPEDCSEKVKALAKHWDCDGHSHSYLTLNELKEAWRMLESLKTPVSGMKDAEQLKKLNESLQSESPDYSLLYPYCQWTNQPNCIEFQVDIPARYMLSGVKKLIDLFDGIDGDDHRIVFWFDN